MERNKGITLVALIITVILMLILASVSVTVAINDKLMIKTQDATKQVQNQMDTQNRWTQNIINEF